MRNTASIVLFGIAQLITIVQVLSLSLHVHSINQRVERLERESMSIRTAQAKRVLPPVKIDAAYIYENDQGDFVDLKTGETVWKAK